MRKFSFELDEFGLLRDRNTNIRLGKMDTTSPA